MFTPQTDGRAHPRGWPMALAIAGRAEAVREGLDRAATYALGLLARATGPEEAGARLHAVRPHAAPNELVVALWDRRLKLRGALKRVGWRFPCETWRPRAPRAVPMEARP